ncbi:hypothetical protein B5181_24440 [Streptomyces sp. 4F]|nr:hypothetical protein B5181_24440 [Streptomyces sp. 4F]
MTAARRPPRPPASLARTSASRLLSTDPPPTTDPPPSTDPAPSTDPPPSAVPLLSTCPPVRTSPVVMLSAPPDLRSVRRVSCGACVVHVWCRVLCGAA